MICHLPISDNILIEYKSEGIVLDIKDGRDLLL